MAKVHIRQYPNLVLTGEVKKALGNKSLSKSVRTEILETFTLLNNNGTNDDYLNKRIEKTHRYKIWEMKFKDKSNTEWRIFFKKISQNTNPAEYGLTNMIRKTTPKLTKRDLDTAVRIAKREGW
ncbi:type II toxin-antitoxin system RelE/ParE family toxin [Rossellomorea vietnamensis]|uniref:type II toxin-antitoxin system RelE/ParE family toxin n=1 Tax=Rossellomorea vietnamensis TaxID=218284 RepID=UPI003CEACEA9